MNIHEYQAKAILRKFGVPVPDGHVCYNSAGAREWAKRLGDGPWVVKAQIHAGGRGKGGGVKLARTADEARHIVETSTSDVVIFDWPRRPGFSSTSTRRSASLAVISLPASVM